MTTAEIDSRDGAPPGGPAIELEDVVKQFGGGAPAAAVRGVSVTIAEGEFFSLLGPSGCGKTTTLRMIGGFEEPTSGAIRLHGHDIVGTPPNRRDVNMVFQSYALFPHLSVFENVAFGLRRRHVPKAEIAGRVQEMLGIVELAERAGSRPRELSGGQQQRVALARALVNRPRALLLDEPLGALDLKLRQTMQLELKRIQREVGITFVYVTHDQNEALTMSDRIAVMNEGLIEQIGPPVEVYERPTTVFVAGFIGTSNVIRGRLSSAHAGLGTIDLGPDGHITVPLRGDLPVAAGAEVNVTVRPEKIRLGVSPDSADCWLRGRVAELVYQGTSTSCTVTTASGASVVVFRQNDGPELTVREGDDVDLAWSTGHTYLLSERPPAVDPGPQIASPGPPTTPSLL